jgi:hypothetical protein
MDPNACKNPTSNGYAVQNINSTSAVSLIRHEDAMRLFNDLKRPDHRIPYLNAANNCDARGHRISQIINQRHGLSTIKVFIEAQNEEFQGAGAPSFTNNTYVDGDGRVRLSTQDISGQSHSWRYHTAPALCVRKDGKDELYIFDLSLFNEPVPYSVWKNRLAGHLNYIQYNSFSTNMYSLSRASEYSPVRTQFESWETQAMNDALRADWSLHQRTLSRPSPLAPGVSTNGIY